MILSNKQKWSIKRAIARQNIWHGSVRATKTVGSLFKFMRLIPLANTNGQIFLVGKTQGSLKRNIIAPLQDYLGNDFRYYPGNQEIKLWDKTIHVVGASDERSVGSIQGSTMSLCYGDEVTLWPENFYNMMVSRLSLKDSIFLGTTNPDNPNHFLKKKIDEGIKGNIDLNDFHFVLDDNEFLDPEVIAELKRNYVGLWYKRFILGMWCVAEGAIYDFFNEDEHTLIRPPLADYFDVGADYATGSPTAFLLMGNSLRPGKPYIWNEREYYFDPVKAQRQKTDTELSRDLAYFLSEVTADVDPIIERIDGVDAMLAAKSTRRVNKPVHNYFMDPSAASLKLQMKRHGFTGIKDADNSVIDGIRVTSALLKNGDYSICQSCTNNIKEKYSYVWDPKQQEIGKDKPIKKHDHAQDAERYVIYTKFGKVSINYDTFTRE